MDHLHGALYVLAITPISATVVIGLVLTLGIVFFLRDKYEGLAYNTSYTAVFGDILLAGVVLIFVEMIKEGILPPDVINTHLYQTANGIGALTIGFVWWRFFDRRAKPADKYHHLVIAPMFIFLVLGLAVPTIVWNGTILQRLLVAVAWLGWLVFQMYDAYTGRLEQRKCIEKRGIKLPS